MRVVGRRMERSERGLRESTFDIKIGAGRRRKPNFEKIKPAPEIGMHFDLFEAWFW